jgi:hypothetical protein
MALEPYLVCNMQELIADKFVDLGNLLKRRKKHPINRLLAREVIREIRVLRGQTFKKVVQTKTNFIKGESDG